MSRREKEKSKSLDALARIAYSAGSAPPPPPSKPALPSVPQAPARKPQPRPPPQPAFETEKDRERRKQLEERKEKLAEEQALRQRRANELTRGANLGWRGMDHMGVPSSIRRTGFDREEPTVAQKLHDVLGEVREKDSRLKNREKGRRQGGR